MACARRGWTNTEMDIISCEICGGSLRLTIPQHATPEEQAELAKQFIPKLSTAHDTLCPWRNSECDPSLGQYPAKSRQVTETEFQERFEKLGQLNCLPPIADAAYAAIQATHKGRLAEFLDQGPRTDAAALPDAVAAVTPARPTRVSPRPDFVWDSAETAQGASAKLVARNNVEFDRRRRMLALCGWTLLPLSRPANSETPTDKAGSIKAIEAALVCTLCQGKIDLSRYIPEAFRDGPPGISGEVMQRLTNTIAGAPLTAGSTSVVAAETTAGPFGGKQSGGSPNPAFGLHAAPAAFGAGHGGFGRPPATSLGTPAAAALLVPPNSALSPPSTLPHQSGQPAFGASGANNPTPVFGVAAIKIKSPPLPRSLSSSASLPRQLSVSTPRQEMVPVSHVGSKRSGDELSISDPEIQVLEKKIKHSPDSVQELDPMESHRPFCPWLSNPDDDGETKEGQKRCGWCWTLEMLIPTAGADEVGVVEQGQADFNPQARLRAILSNVWM
eukprot:jgi/Botrbrau1/17588/Bobra.0166s0030.1